MVKATAAIERSTPAPRKKPAKRPRKVSLDYFLKNYSDKEDGFKYEFNNGIIEKTVAMNPAQAFIIVNLQNFLFALSPKAGGALLAELKQMTSATQLRRPDLAYLTKAQIQSARQGKEVTAEFMVEIISDTDQVNPLNNKLFEYFEAGVKVVWLIHPQFEMVHVYTSPLEMKICRGEMVCSAEPVVPGFKMKASEVFKAED